MSMSISMSISISLSLSFSLCVYIYIYIYTHTCLGPLSYRPILRPASLPGAGRKAVGRRRQEHNNVNK